MRNETGEYLYDSLEACRQSGGHLTSCDDDGYCTACGYQDDEDEDDCPDGKHEPDLSSIQASGDAPGVVDIWCGKCGRCGSVLLNPDDIQW